MVALFSKKTKHLPQRRDIARARQRDAEKAAGDVAESYSFRRSHTMTGSASSHVRSSNEHAAQLRSPRVKSHELARKRRVIIGLLAGCLLGAITIFFVIYNFTAGVTVTIDNDPSVAPKSNYATSVQEYFNGSPAERLRIFTNNTDLTDSLRQKHPEVLSAAIDGRTGLGGSQLHLRMRTPVAEWTVNGKKMYVDHDGIAFAQNYRAEPSVKIVDLSGIRVAENQMLVSNAFLSFVGQVVGASEKLENMKVTQITLPPNTTRQIAVSIDGYPYSVKMSTDRGAGVQVEDMAHAIQWLQSQGRAPRYIDVRVEGQAFYK